MTFIEKIIIRKHVEEEEICLTGKEKDILIKMIPYQFGIHNSAVF